MSTTAGPIDPALTGISTVASPILKDPVVVLMKAAFYQRVAGGAEFIIRALFLDVRTPTQ
ncbi:protein of unknown function [Methylocella tundrae]|uniref:Uncharacterized protein n=1 Tax=Methylocella tundrae TaxID=227605 RepID=A0A4U8Z4H5_METTU|nr:protein of unknown function [Methylocella tundrae]